MQGGQILENQTKRQKFTEEKEKERKAELQKIEGLFYHLLQEKDTELHEVIQLQQQVQDTQYLQGIKLYFCVLVLLQYTNSKKSVFRALY